MNEERVVAHNLQFLIFEQKTPIVTDSMQEKIKLEEILVTWDVATLGNVRIFSNLICMAFVDGPGKPMIN